MRRTRITGLALCIAAYGLAVVALVSWEVLGRATTGLPGPGAMILFADKFFVDILVVMLVAGLLVNLGRPWRFAAYAWAFLFFAAYAVQAGAVWIGGEFLTFLAVDNIHHISLLVNPASLAACGLLVLISILVMVLVEKRFPARASARQVGLFAGVVLAGVLILESQHWVPDDVAAARDNLYVDRGVRLAHKSPLESLYKVLLGSEGSELRNPLPSDLEVARRLGIHLDPEQQFPLVKPRVHQSGAPFPDIGGGIESPNVIVFFAEGIAARTLGSYADFQPRLTPNLDEFAREAMVVDNYYNHTYATYRGLVGQLCSFFPTHGGLGGWDTHIERVKRVSYLCLNNLFTDSGYETIFLDTHRRDHAFVDEMMEQLGFDTVLTAEDMVGTHVPGEPLRRDSLSDNQLMEGLVSLLKQREGNPGKPFFLGLYNLETHAFQKIRADGKPYAGGNHYILDAIHNLDHAFGKFWRYFRESPWVENTVVVFTSDHTHYPHRDFLEIARGPAFDPDYRPYFVDRIPLIIRHPGLDLPPRFDAKIASAVDFAPSMIHLMGLPNGENPFVGNSIFDPEKYRGDRALASAGQDHYVVDATGVAQIRPDWAMPEDMPPVPFVISLLQELELHDRIWPR